MDRTTVDQFAMTRKSTNLNNEQVNRIHLCHAPYERVGSCENCNARCCNFICLQDNDFVATHGQRITDQWNGNIYVVVPALCSNCVGVRCSVFGKKEMPGACQQFPINPFDSHWRYLKQIGTPCGFDFIDKATGKPWDMTLKMEADYKAPKGMRSFLKFVKGTRLP